MIEQFSPVSESPRSSSRRTPKSPRPFSPLDSRHIANIVVAKNLNQANPQVQIQALEVSGIRTVLSVSSNYVTAHARQAQFFTDCRSRRSKTISLHCIEREWILAIDNALGTHLPILVLTPLTCIE
jgi:hypothetical protein